MVKISSFNDLVPCSNNKCSSSLVACPKATHDSWLHSSLDIVYTNLAYSRPPMIRYQATSSASSGSCTIDRLIWPGGAYCKDTHHKARFRVPPARFRRARNNNQATAATCMQATMFSSHMRLYTVTLTLLCNELYLLTRITSDVLRDRTPKKADSRQLL